MIIEMTNGYTDDQVDDVVRRAESLGFSTQLNVGTDRMVVAILGSDVGQVDTDVFAVLSGVERVTRIMKPYKLASREFKRENSTFNVKGIEIGGRNIVVMAGPCAVESEKQLMETAWAVKEAGAHMLRGGAFKPRTSPFSFQGLGKPGLELLGKARKEVGLPVITEVMDPQHVTLVSEFADMLQIGARNMQNFTLLSEVGTASRPTLLKRGLSATITEWLTAADYLLSEGHNQIALCERGIRTFENTARFSLDVTSIPVVQESSHLPIIVDPSHAAGHHSLVPAIAKAAVAAGADGLLIEVHSNPEEAQCDGLQALTPSGFADLMKDLKLIATSVGRHI